MAQFIHVDPPLNADILDEAGRAVICRGFAASFNSPVTILGLTNSGALKFFDEYVIRPDGQQAFRAVCTQIYGSAAVFQTLS